MIAIITDIYKIAANNKFIFVIDNFEFIDGFSYEFITRYINFENIWKNLKLLLILGVTT